MTGRISAAILAGGTGSRLNGRIKPLIIIEGQMIISRLISVLSDIFQEIIIVTNNPKEFEEFRYCKIVQDEIINAGPLGGIHTALKTATGEAVFVFAGDMPFPDKQLIMKMIDAYENKSCDALIPMIEDYIEPLHSIYHISLVKPIENYLESNINVAVVDFVKTINVRYLHLENSVENKKAFTNINSPEDLMSRGKKDSGILP